ncbi:MAG: FtsX-like permease family protein [Thermoflexales bacterium]|nr:FtsX-like permease family protein [Thermoflexales bacterium]
MELDTMLGPRWYKVLADLGGNKTRTLLVVLSIAAGVFAVGTVTGSYLVLAHDMAASYAASRPASAILYTSPFGDDLVQSVRRMATVSTVEGRRAIAVRVETGSGQWRNLNLEAISDYNDIHLDLVRSERGAWPPPDRELLVERAALADLKAEIGDEVLIEMPDGKRRSMRLAGVAYYGNYPGPMWSGNWLQGYIAFDTLEWLGVGQDFDELHVAVAGDATDEAHVRRIADLVGEKIEKGGGQVYWKYIPPPEHWANFLVEAMMAVLGILGSLTLGLSAFLVVNTISALMTQQVRQIGMMKAVGARLGQLIGMYLLLALGFGLLATLVAIPLSILVTQALTSFIASLLNFEPDTFSVPLPMITIQVLIGLLTPLLAASYPVFAGTRLTVREAVSSYGLGKGHFGRNVIDRLVENVRGLPRPLLLSLRNVFRRKGRLALTLATLTLGGAVFMAVVSVKSSIDLTTQDLMNYYQEDIAVYFNDGYRVEQIEQEALAVPGVARLECRAAVGARRVRPDGSESNSINLHALSPASDLLCPIMVEGRWLLPEDENAIVVGTDMLREEPDLHVGDEIVLTILGKQRPWRVVGAFLVIGSPGGLSAYVNYPYATRTTGVVGRAWNARIVAERHDPASQAAIAKAVETRFKRAGLRISAVETKAAVRGQIDSQVNILIYFLLAMSVIIAAVGGLGLMGTMGINVLERTREFGVMRAVGASNGAVGWIVVVEGILVGMLSWGLGAILAVPISRVMSDELGQAFFNTPLRHSFASSGVLIWLGIVVVLAAAASLWPAWNAARLPVREVLAYE